MSQSELEALLGRSLTSNEIANRDTYLEIAKDSIEELLCISLNCENIEETRVFDVREGYSTVFTDIFIEIESVEVGSNTTTDYTERFWDKRSNDFYNSIVLGSTCKTADTVTITAVWGFESLPNDLKLLWAQMFANVSKKYVVGGGNVKRKSVRNFDITYGNETDDQLFLDANTRTISKYSMCNIGYVRHGKTCSVHRRFGCGICI